MTLNINSHKSALYSFLNTIFTSGISFVTVFLYPFAFCFSDEHDDSHSNLIIISESYKANKNSFVHGKCVFSFSETRGKTNHDPLSEQWVETRKPMSTTFTLIWKGDSLVVKTPINDIIDKNVLNNNPFIQPYNVMQKEGYYIDHDSIIDGATVGSPSDEQLNIRYHPFNLSLDSMLNPSIFIDCSQNDSFANPLLTIEDNVNYEGNLYTKITTSGDFSSENYTFYIDPLRGFLPIITQRHYKTSGKLLCRMEITNIAEYSGTWFPMRSLQYMRLLDGTYQVREMKVIDLDLDFEPSQDDLSFQLSRHTQFYHPDDDYTAKSLFRDKKLSPIISVNEIAGIYNALEDIAKERRKDAIKRSKR